MSCGSKRISASIFMQSLKIFKSVKFRRAVTFSVVFALSNAVLFAFIYWQACVNETALIKTFLERQARIFADASDDQINWNISHNVARNLHRITFFGIFGPNGQFLAGDIKAIPVELPVDGIARKIDNSGLPEPSVSIPPVVAIAQRLQDGRILVIGRNIQELGDLKEIVVRTLRLGVIPLSIVAIIVGFILSQQMNRRLTIASQSLDQVKAGKMDRRLIVGGSGDEFDLLASQVNLMLDDLQCAMSELRHVGNYIAHDLRTPLARVRAQMERLKTLPAGGEDHAELLDRAICNIDQTVAMSHALLRIADIENGNRRNSFANVDLYEIMMEAKDLYEPLAEEKQVELNLYIEPVSCVRGDRDLLFEVLANLLDNAIKFAPGCGRVDFSLSNNSAGPIISVRDNGPGIPADQRKEVFNRFYRGSHSSNATSNGLGLSLVSAIVKLHRFTIEIKESSSGCIFELRCFPAPFPLNNAMKKIDQNPNAALQPSISRIFGNG